MAAYLPPPGMDRRPTGRNLLAAAWSLLRSHRSLLVLPFLSAVSGTAAALMIAVPGVLLALPRDGRELTTGALAGMLMLLWVSLFVTTAISIYFQIALLVAVFEHLEGRPVSLASALALATRRLASIVAWAMVAATVGTLLRMLAERGIIGALTSAVLRLGWAVAAFFVVPIIACEDLGPIAALRRSASLFRGAWGPSARASIRYGLVHAVAVLPPIAAMALLVVSGAPAAAVIVVGTLAIAYLAVAGIVLSALGVVVRGLLYRYASGLPVPGIDTRVLARAVG